MKLALALTVLVAVVVLLIRLSESRFAFFPLPGETVTPKAFGVGYETVSITTADAQRLRAWELGVATRAQIVYFHGNGGNLSIWAPILAGIARNGYSVLAVDYRGYGASTGRPTEPGLYRDVDAVVAHFWAKRREDTPVVYWGRSLGGTMAAYAATVRAPDGVILESAFPDMRTLVRSSPPMALLALFSSYRFPTADLLQGVRAPVLVMHGDRDSVVPFGQGRALFERIAEPKQFVTIRGGDHNDMAPRDPLAYWGAISEFVTGL